MSLKLKPGCQVDLQTSLIHPHIHLAAGWVTVCSPSSPDVYFAHPLVDLLPLSHFVSLSLSLSLFVSLSLSISLQLAVAQPNPWWAGGATFTLFMLLPPLCDVIQSGHVRLLSCFPSFYSTSCLSSSSSVSLQAFPTCPAWAVKVCGLCDSEPRTVSHELKSWVLSCNLRVKSREPITMGCESWAESQEPWIVRCESLAVSREP